MAPISRFPLLRGLANSLSLLWARALRIVDLPNSLILCYYLVLGGDHRYVGHEDSAMSETMMKEHAEGSSAAPADGPESAPVAAVQASNDWWHQLDKRIYQCIELWWEPHHHILIEAVGEVFGQERHNQREAIAENPRARYPTRGNQQPRSALH